MARASESEQTGSVGVSEALGKFGRIGFGFAEITRHDNGTDVFLMARDARRFDLGLTLAAQIKGGPSHFKRSKKGEDEKTVGWWFYDPDGQHIDDWLRHGLPFLLVLHDLDADITYWVHVTDDAVIPTGKGKKILVPTHQRVDAEGRDELVAIAATTRPASAWEGSAWRGAESVLERDLLRYALLVPRLVAPHPNARQEDHLSASQGIAMVMQARIRDLDRLHSQGLVPSAEQARNNKDWHWRFYAALHQRVTTGNVDHLIDMQTGAPTPAPAAAAAVVVAACLMEEDRADEATALVLEAVEADTAEPVDHAWLSVQLARAYAEIGHLEDARALAGSVLSIAATHSMDVTATAVAAAGAQLLSLSTQELTTWARRLKPPILPPGGGVSREVAGL